MLTYLALLLAYRLLGWLPIPAAYFIADSVGTVMYYLRPGLRKNTQRNMRQVLGPEAPAEEVRRQARRVVRNATRYYADLVTAPRVDVQRFYRERMNVISGLDELQQAIASKRGVIAASAHYANPEIVLQAASAIGIRTFSLTEPLKPKRLNDLVHKLRASHGQVFRPLSLSSVREAIRWLRDGKVVPLLCDRDIQNSGMPLPFFGAVTRVPVGATELALRTGALVIPMFCRRIDGNRFDIFCEPAIEMEQTGDHEEDVRVNTLKIIGAIERCVRGDPGQWMVLEPIWGRDIGEEQELAVSSSQTRGV